MALHIVELFLIKLIKNSVFRVMTKRKKISEQCQGVEKALEILNTDKSILETN